MRFELILTLGNDDAVTGGPDALGGYLRDVASHVQSGYGNGNVRDVNGNTIGRYAIEDGSRRADHFTADEVDALIGTAGDLYNAGGDPHDVLSSRQRSLADRATALLIQE